MGEVVPFLTDEDCDACVASLKKTYAKATQSIVSVSSPALQNKSLRELLIGGEGVDGEKDSTAKKIKKDLAPRSPSARKARKCLVELEEDEEEQDGDGEFRAPKSRTSVSGSKGPKKSKKAQVKRWNQEKHSVIVDAISYDDTHDAIVVDAKLSTHGKAATRRVLVYPADVDKISEEYWTELSSLFLNKDMPAAFKETRFAAFCAK